MLLRQNGLLSCSSVSIFQTRALYNRRKDLPRDWGGWVGGGGGGHKWHQRSEGRRSGRLRVRVNTNMSLCVWKIHTHECTQLLQDGFIALGLADGFCGCGHWSVCSPWPTFNIRTQTHRYTHTHTFPASLCICFSPHSWACCAQRGPANEKDTDTLALTLSYFILCVPPEDWFVLCRSETLDLNWLDSIRIPHRAISVAFPATASAVTIRLHLQAARNPQSRPDCRNQPRKSFRHVLLLFKARGGK